MKRCPICKHVPIHLFDHVFYCSNCKARVFKERKLKPNSYWPHIKIHSQFSLYELMGDKKELAEK